VIGSSELHTVTGTRSSGVTIHLASEPGRGITFRILLPSASAVAEEAAGQLSSAGEPARELPSATVLIVEDEDALRQSVAKMLRRKGAVVLEAANGSAAIDLLLTVREASQLYWHGGIELELGNPTLPRDREEAT
jgi:hypothetical protein